MNELPRGWNLSTIHDLIGFDGLFSDGDWVESKDQDPEGNNRLLQLADIGDGYFINKSNRFVNDEQFSRLRCTELKANDVLVARMPDPLGRACLMPVLSQRCLTVVDVAIIRPGRGSVSPKWFMYFLNAPQIREEIHIQSTGTTRKRIARGKLAEMELPVPPLAEQNRIADKLETLLARVDTTRARLDCIPELLKRFRQSVLAAATSGQLTEEWRKEGERQVKVEEIISEHRALWPKEAGKYKYPDGVDEELWELPRGWAWASASAVVRPGAEIVYGIVQPGPKLDVGIPYVRGMDIENGKILINQLMKTSPEIANKYAKASLKGGDVLLGIIRATKVAVVPDSLDGANITQGTARLRPGQFLMSNYLAIALSAPKIQKWLHEHYRGIDMPGLNLADVRKTPLPIPPLLEQQEIVRRVESLLGLADKLDSRYQTASGQVDKLTPALLAKAFRGELVPQDSNDEPAEQLLARIRAARELSPTRTTRKARTVRSE